VIWPGIRKQCDLIRLCLCSLDEIRIWSVVIDQRFLFQGKRERERERERGREKEM
jgi:hypothetical protein